MRDRERSRPTSRGVRPSRSVRPPRSRRCSGTRPRAWVRPAVRPRLTAGRGRRVGRDTVRLVSRSGSPRWPTANAGAPSRLTTSVMPYQSRPTPIALPVGTPSGCSSSTSRPSRMPSPESEIGSTCAGRDRGHEREHRAVRHRRRRARGSRTTPRAAPRPGTTIAATSTPSARRGSRRMRSTPMCTAPMKRIQFWCLAKRPARCGLPATTRITTRATTVAPAMASAIHACRASRSDGSSAKPMNVRSGSATKPLSRSMTTDAKAMSPVPVDFDGPADAEDVAADRRRQHVADELTGEVVPEQRAQRDVGVEHREARAASATPRARTRRG